MEGSPKLHLGKVLSNDFDQFNPDPLKDNDWICMIFVLHGFSLVSGEDPMEPQNITWVSEFVLSGFSQTQEFQKFLFLVFLIVYVTTVVGNLLILIAVTFDSQLHMPMYFLLRNPAVIDLC